MNDDKRKALLRAKSLRALWTKGGKVGDRAKRALKLKGLRRG